LPSSILSHQGIVLPLKIKYPEKFDGIALCVGSVAPDLPFILSFFLGSRINRYVLFHSVGGLIYTVPLSLLLVFLFNRFLLPIIAYVASKNRFGPISYLLAFFGFDDFGLVKSMRFSLTWLLKATYSVVIGIFSHFLLDLPTHGYIPYLKPFFSGIMPSWFLIEYSRLNIPFYGIFEVTNYNILWVSFSIILGIIALYNLRYIKKNKLMMKWYGFNT
jgi:hypothetical protein